MGIKFSGGSAKLGQTGPVLIVVPVTKAMLGAEAPAASTHETEVRGVLGFDLRKELKRRKFDPKGDKPVTFFRADTGRIAVCCVPATRKYPDRLWNTRLIEKMAEIICAAAKANSFTRILIPWGEMPLVKSDFSVAKAFFLTCLQSEFSFKMKGKAPKKKTKKSKKPEAEAETPESKDLEFVLLGATEGELSKGEQMRAVSDACSFARRLILTPSNVMTPAKLGEEATAHITGEGVEVIVHGKDWLSANGWGGVLAVSQGSPNDPVLIEVHYTPAGMSKAEAHKTRIGLVGKGVTFDTGGLYPKAPLTMNAMKGDMGGAAAVLGAMLALVRLKPNIPVSAFVAATENMIDGKAYRPSDVVTLLSGKTMNVVHPDAEGRVTLADALHYASKRCAMIVDVATLTGNAIAALGPDLMALFSRDNDLARQLLLYGKLCGEPSWRMPLYRPYDELVSDDLADVRNLANGNPAFAGAITAAHFVRRFVPKRVRHAHWDIASSVSDLDKGHCTGFGVRTLVEVVQHYAAKQSHA